MEKFVLRQVLEPKDEMEKFIILNVLAIVQDKNTFELLKHWGTIKFNDEKIGERYFLKIMDVITSLFKANHSRRNYKKLVLNYKNRVLKKIQKSQPNVDMEFQNPDLVSELDNFLAHIKASLDSLAKSLNPIFDIKVDGWHKKKDKASGRVISGQNVLNSLNNLPANLADNLPKLKELLADNAEYITYLVSLRDAPFHKGGIKNVQGFTFSVDQRELQNPLLVHPDGKSELLSDFLDRTISEFAEFIQTFIVRSISGLVSGTYLIKDKGGKFNWHIVAKN